MRRQFVTPEMVVEMKRREAEGMSRKEIADLMNLHPASVTKHLGAVRQYRGLRMPKAA
jgi:DNA-binding CsgD family transcriptional regulator